jgi:hypothetical protein
MVGALTGLWLVSAAGDRVQVVAVAREVPLWATIGEADLRLVEVSLDPGLDVIPADQFDDVVGSVAAVGLTPGTLLTPTSFSTASPPARGEVLVGLAVASGRMPTGQMAAGESVLVVETPSNDAEAVTGPPRTIRATVVRVAEPDLNGVTVVDVTVPSGDGAALAAVSATGRVAVVVEPRGGAS